MALLLAACGGRLTAPPEALQETADPMPIVGETLSLSAAALVGGLAAAQDAYDYQWMKDGLDLPQEQGPTLVLPAVALADAGAYQVRVTPRPPGSPPAPQAAAPRAVGGTPAPDPAAAIVSPPFDVEPVDQDWLVTSLDDAGPGTLRAVLEALGAAPGVQRVQGIRFQPPPGALPVVRLQSDLPPITGAIRILGPPGPTLILDGGGLHRPFFVDGGDLTLDDLIVRNGLAKGGDAPGGGGGAAGMGGGLFLNQGAATLRRVTFHGNTAQGGSSFPGSDGENGGGAGFGGDSPLSGGDGAGGGFLGGQGGTGHLDGVATTDSGGGPAIDGDGAGGGAARGGLLTDPVATWADNLPGGEATFGGGGGFSVGPQGGGGDGSTFGGGGGGSGGGALGLFLPGSGGGSGGVFGGDGKAGNGVTGGTGGGGGGMGGAIFHRRGTLTLVECQFLFNRAAGGQGGEAGLGKGGAVFVHKFDQAEVNQVLAMLKAQAYAGNLATDLVESPTFDNDDYYVAQTVLAVKPGSPLDLTYRLYRLNLKYGFPWLR